MLSENPLKISVLQEWEWASEFKAARENNVMHLLFLSYHCLFTSCFVFFILLYCVLLSQHLRLRCRYFSYTVRYLVLYARKWTLAHIICKIWWFGRGIQFQSTTSAEKVENIILFPVSYEAYKEIENDTPFCLTFEVLVKNAVCSWSCLGKIHFFFITFLLYVSVTGRAFLFQ